MNYPNTFSLSMQKQSDSGRVIYEVESATIDYQVNLP
jgi:hypothetical protein